MENKDLGKCSSGLQPNVAACLSYVAGFVTGLIFYLTEKENKFVRFHAMQSIVTFGPITILNAIFQAIPTLPTHIIGWIIFGLGVALWAILMYKAYHGERYKLPIAGDVTENLLKSTGK